MSKRFNLLIICFLPSIVAWGDVPNQFQAGSPAIAAEVNQNFANLDGRVAALETTGGVVIIDDTGQQIGQTISFSSDMATVLLTVDGPLGTPVNVIPTLRARGFRSHSIVLFTTDDCSGTAYVESHFRFPTLTGAFAILASETAGAFNLSRIEEQLRSASGSH